MKRARWMTDTRSTKRLPTTAARQMSFYLVTSFIFMAVMVVGFTAYFFVVEDFGGVLETFYFVIVTVRTIGFGDYSPQTNAGRIGTILLALLPATVFLGASLVVLETAMKSLEQIWRKWMLGKNNNHTIVIAHTDLLASIVHELDAHESPYVILHSAPMLDLPQAVAEAVNDSNFLYGNQGSDETLIQAGVKKAAHIIIATQSDAENLYVLVTAKGLNPEIKATVRVNEEATQARFLTVGADYLLPSATILGRMLSQAAVSPICSKFLVQLNTRTQDPFIKQVEPLEEDIGKAVREAFPRAVALYTDGEYRYNVEQETLRKDDVVLLIDERMKR